MNRKIRIALLAFGTVAGYGAGIAHLACFRAHHAAFEHHVAQICVDAARDAKPTPPPAASPR